jgi:hypothetical protein
MARKRRKPLDAATLQRAFGPVAARTGIIGQGEIDQCCEQMKNARTAKERGNVDDCVMGFLQRMADARQRAKEEMAANHPHTN